MKIINRYFYTIKDLYPIQIYKRIYYKLFITKILFTNKKIIIRKSNNNRKILFLNNEDYFFIIENNCKIEILNKKINFSIIHDWNSKKFDALTIYNINYFDFITNDDSKKKDKINIIEKWIKYNKNKKNPSWDSYPTSLRIVNWIKWSIQNDYINKEFILSLYEQSLWLSKKIEYHLKGNHLIANAKALIFAGIYFKENNSSYLLGLGVNILIKELEVQILNNGAHYERSPMYHVIITEDLLDIISLYKKYNLKIDDRIVLTAKKMIKWINFISHSDNSLPFFGDTCYKIARSVEDINYYGKKILSINLEKNNKIINQVDAAGYYVLKNHNNSFIANVGHIISKEQPGHSHADLLSFELNLYKNKVFVNSGISTYEKSNLRHFQRSTVSKNTLTLNDKNSQDVWASFRVGKKTRIESLKINKSRDNKFSSSIEASHCGFGSFFSKNLHKRKWIISENSLHIIDSFTGKHDEAKSRIYLHPSIKCFKNYLIMKNNKIIKFEFIDCNLNVIQSRWAYSFNILYENQCMEFTANKNVFEIKFIWD